MIKIEKSSNDSNFAEEIKHIRQHTADRYGKCSSLLTAKAMIEDIMNEQRNSPVFAIAALSKDMGKQSLELAIEQLQSELAERYPGSF